MCDITQRQTEKEAAAMLTHGSGQGRSQDVAFRKAVENYAMERAKQHYQKQGWDVQDTSAHKPYDLQCNKERKILYVEVKGTTTAGAHVIVTYNEVEHARTHAGKCALFVVRNIQVRQTDQQEYVASCGEEKIYEPWTPIENTLKPITYRHTLQ